ncbi:MAG: FtsX-like permease family protein, partial [Bacteroidota bacterium]|nr:FtsX-like permease family protein [Bacteroidota bacterium]
DISKMRNSPTVISHHTNSITWTGKDPSLDLSFADEIVGYDFVKTLGLRLDEGRDFSRAYNDSTSFLLNETAVKKMGFTHPVGQTVIWGNQPGTVIGVIRDFNFNSLHNKIDPLIIHLDEGWTWGTVLVRLKAGGTQAALAKLKEICTTLNPGFPFTFRFSDQAYDKLYKSEEVTGVIADIFAFLAIFISCLGLYGLAILTAEQRTREIGIRKVLGATASQIMQLLSASFLKPILFSLLIAFPVAWWVASNWLDSYAYRIHLGWSLFGISAGLALLVGIATISFQTIRASITSPVKSLRAE